MQRLEFRAMGCQMLAIIDSDDASASEALSQAPIWFAEWEASLSRFRDDSELSALNRAEGKPFRVSATMWQVLQAAMRAANRSDGLVTPTLLDTLQAAGYDRSFESIETSVPSARAPAFRPIADWRAIKLDAKTQTVRLPRGMHLDFGGVAKGWAADQAAQRLAAVAPALVDAGGDIAISDTCANGAPWPIAVADPLNPDSDLEMLMIDHGGVATSGRDYRRWLRNGKWQHHIIDPRTGAPAETDVLSATVIAPTTTAAEVAAKVALILGSQKGLQWIETRSDLAGLLVLEDGRIARSGRMDDDILNDHAPSLENSVLPAWS
jgi:thiamine biosynthesis lipoprotein